MSIANRVAEALHKLDANQADNAAIQICSAIDATAKNEYGGKVGSRFKQFVAENWRFITKYGMGVGIENLRLAYDHPNVDKDSDGLVSAQNIFYYALRNCLVHESTIPMGLVFTKENVIHVDAGRISIPIGLLAGCVISVVLSPTNHDQRFERPTFMRYRGFPLNLDKVWGRRDQFEWLCDVLNSSIDECERLDRIHTVDPKQESPKA